MKYTALKPKLGIENRILGFNFTPKLGFVKKLPLFHLINFFFVTLATVILGDLPSLYACSVCFGKGSEDLQKGFYWGILLLLLLPVALIGTIGTAIIYSSRKK
ncbi:MAG: hypothetical protein A3I11_06775 [Elusimicrobia bacterium RIFCSPLOWO2_02_FULL_39_32]|nr:MAG: hypothetical protein A2034_04755 [Elusimicrobia bacterium GWA2_38_7]OGR81108.1 MAG: hypothetical protein A3B80_03630 [Elusimicrobia bacterium RIFCSPHIGHO2_02_FULL_39_36]OGR90996.1 MAG: hypothetical protein A3I11_06775 [Elusimicrobia bacterium RIFCSPLOWO2_02_FULL_39_32]OGR98304.1 MAG: hypothetical protein A3G85_07540 [Elusimicrobia bacterium RIFCSPLOWO2_12_FULL_39_28]